MAGHGRLFGLGGVAYFGWTRKGQGRSFGLEWGLLIVAGQGGLFGLIPGGGSLIVAGQGRLFGPL